ncbi:MAG TPA: hypothetical protein VII73_08330 [Caulobacteraceae bacterium]
MTVSQIGPHEHPSPHRDRVSPWTSLLALAAGPGAWILQLSVDFGVATSVCEQGGAPRAASPNPGWGPVDLFLVCFNLACLAIALAGGMTALAAWRRSRAEKPGCANAVLDVGEGRTRFLALCGMLTAAVFAIAILFDTAWPFFVPPCWRFAP